MPSLAVRSNCLFYLLTIGNYVTSIAGIMPTKYYVTARRSFGAMLETKRLCGPFDKMGQAVTMVEPIRKALQDLPEFKGSHFATSELTISAAKLKAGKKWPRTAIDLTLIDPVNIIHASRLR
jgi:hypothetical protein